MVLRDSKLENPIVFLLNYTVCMSIKVVVWKYVFILKTRVMAQIISPASLILDNEGEIVRRLHNKKNK